MDGRIRKFANTLTSFSWIQSSRRALNKHGVQVASSLLIALISSLISCVQLNVAVINLRDKYLRDRQDVLRLLSMSSGHHKLKKRANHHRRRFWRRPGRTSAWWDNFINGTMIEEEWRENFRMSKTSLLKLAEELRPYIEGKETIMRSPVDVVKQVALTLYYLSDIVHRVHSISSGGFQQAERHYL